MAHALSVDAIISIFLYPNLPSQPGKTDYMSIRDTHRLLTANAASIKSPRGGVQNVHLGLILTITQYSLVSQVPFVLLTYPGQSPTIPAWIAPFD